MTTTDRDIDTAPKSTASAPPATTKPHNHYFDPPTFCTHVQGYHDASHTQQCRNNHLQAAITMAIEVARQYTATYALNASPEQREDIIAEATKRFLSVITRNKVTSPPEGNPLALLDRITQNETRRLMAKAKARPI